MTNEIITGDNIEVMKKMEECSIDLTVTSPPYDNLRSYKGYEFNFEEVVEQLYRITKQGGVVVWVVGDATVKGSETGTSFKQALYFMERGFNLHDTMIYEKNTAPFPQSNRYNSLFEYMFVFSKGTPNVFNPLKTPAISNLGRLGKRDGSYRQADGSLKGAEYEGRSSEKTKGNIWKYSVGRNNSTKDKVAFDHPAIFPEKLAEDHIISWSNEGGVVLDPFGGSGTTAKMAKLNNRDCIHIDISEDYNSIARQRIEEAVKQKEIDDAQTDIFDFLEE